MSLVRSRKFFGQFEWVRVGLSSITLVCLLLSAALQGSEESETADELLQRSGRAGGVMLHLGCSDGKLTVELGRDEFWTVHGLDQDEELIETSRHRIQELGIYGRVSVELFSGETLPYTDNLINLIVVDDPGLVASAEMMRVLSPGGLLSVRRGDVWEFSVKPRPDNIDDWTHYLHDASNNAVAQDELVGPPKNLQWVAPPLWLRSHETPSGIESPVSDGERLYYILDEGVIGVVDKRLPDRWALVCRDAFNGHLLWRRKLEAWGWREWRFAKDSEADWTKVRARRVVPGENQRRVVAVDGKLYATLAYHAPLSILDAATGRVIATVKGTNGTREILVSDGIAVVHIQDSESEFNRKRGVNNKKQSRVCGVDGVSGEVLWKVDTGTLYPLTLTIAGGRVVYFTGKDMVALDLKSGEQLWRVRLNRGRARSVLISDGVVVILGGKFVAAHALDDGNLLWEKDVNPIPGAEGSDLFAIDGVVWRGIESVDNKQAPARKSANALVVGWDLKTGNEQQQVFVSNLRSPEHHHRCYRNKATERYLISSLEGAEFLDFQGDDHSQANWIRGSCSSGMMPCNGMLYVPPDQCFCQPGAKLLGYTAVKAGGATRTIPRPDDRRLETGPAFGMMLQPAGEVTGDWPTYRHDAARSGTTSSLVKSSLGQKWTTEIGGRITAPVVASGRIFVASVDAHTLHALGSRSGKVLWQFTAGGRIDSAPTIYRGLVLFGARDGYVYCLRSADGALVWRFLAAPLQLRVAAFDQLESVWPVHGSILVDQGVAYCTAGRSTYLDGGIRLYGLDPATGQVIHQGNLSGPFPEVPDTRDLAFFLPGANSDILVSEGGHLYMRQKKLTHELEEVDVEVLSSKGAQDVGLHVFSTSGFLDDSWYNRTFWMYSKRWPGFQLANQAPKSGQLLVVDQEKTYAVRVFYRRNVHSPMFFPGKEGYLLFADKNDNEPQIVGEPGSRPPVKWLPQSDFSRARGNEMRKLDSEAFGLDKMIGYTRAEPPVWKQWLPVRIRAMVKADKVLFVAGAADVFDEQDPYAVFDTPPNPKVVAVSSEDGEILSEIKLDAPPVFDGMIAAEGGLFISLENGNVSCLRGDE